MSRVEVQPLFPFEFIDPITGRWTSNLQAVGAQLNLMGDLAFTGFGDVCVFDIGGLRVGEGGAGILMFTDGLGAPNSIIYPDIGGVTRWGATAGHNIEIIGVNSNVDIQTWAGGNIDLNSLNDIYLTAGWDIFIDTTGQLYVRSAAPVASNEYHGVDDGGARTFYIYDDVVIGSPANPRVVTKFGDLVLIDGPAVFEELPADPGATANRGKVYTKDIAGTTELFYQDSAGSVIQLTGGGSLSHSLDQAYDDGRTIIVDAGPVELEITQTSGDGLLLDMNYVISPGGVARGIRFDGSGVTVGAGEDFFPIFMDLSAMATPVGGRTWCLMVEAPSRMTAGIEFDNVTTPLRSGCTYFGVFSDFGNLGGVPVQGFQASFYEDAPNVGTNISPFKSSMSLMSGSSSLYGGYLQIVSGNRDQGVITTFENFRSSVDLNNVNEKWYGRWDRYNGFDVILADTVYGRYLDMSAITLTTSPPNFAGDRISVPAGKAAIHIDDDNLIYMDTLGTKSLHWDPINGWFEFNDALYLPARFLIEKAPGVTHADFDPVANTIQLGDPAQPVTVTKYGDLDIVAGAIGLDDNYEMWFDTARTAFKIYYPGMPPPMATPNIIQEDMAPSGNQKEWYWGTFGDNQMWLATDDRAIIGSTTLYLYGPSANDLISLTANDPGYIDNTIQSSRDLRIIFNQWFSSPPPWLRFDSVAGRFEFNDDVAITKDFIIDTIGGKLYYRRTAGLDRYLEYDDIKDRFHFNARLKIMAGILIEEDTITFDPDGTNKSLKWNDTDGQFEFDGPVSNDGELLLGKNLSGFQILLRIFRDGNEVGRIDNDGSDIRIRAPNGGDVKLADDVGTKLIVKDGGKVGIGTTIPDEKLTIKNGSVIASEGFATKLWNISGGNFETAQVGVEYYSPNQQGGIYGPVYRQYFTTTLPSNLTSGNNVSRLVDYSVYFKYTTANRGIARGSTSTYGTATHRIYIMLSGSSGNGNLSWSVGGYTVKDGWVDYIKA